MRKDIVLTVLRTRCGWTITATKNVVCANKTASIATIRIINYKKYLWPFFPVKVLHFCIECVYHFQLIYWCGLSLIVFIFRLYCLSLHCYRTNFRVCMQYIYSNKHLNNQCVSPIKICYKESKKCKQGVPEDPGSFTWEIGQRSQWRPFLPHTHNKNKQGKLLYTVTKMLLFFIYALAAILLKTAKCGNYSQSVPLRQFMVLHCKIICNISWQMRCRQNK